MRSPFSTCTRTLMVLFSLWILSSMWGCQRSQQPPSGPASAQETSEARTSLSERRAFLEQYVTFRRTYLELEYKIFYQNNSQGLPGPSDWDIALRAVVPKEEVADWIPSDASREEREAPDWATHIPGKIDASQITTWYRSGQREVGVDKEAGIIAYRHHTMP